MEAGNSYGGLSPADLLERVAAHDGRAWEELVDRYVGLVWATTRNHGLSHEDAIDVGQTVWLKLSQHIGRIRDPERVGLWLQTTARNECIRLLNQRARTVAVDPHDAFAALPATVEPLDAGLERIEQDRAVWQAFEELPERCRVLLRLLVADPPVPYKDISDVTGIAVGSIGSRRQRCLSALRAALNVQDRAGLGGRA